MEAAALPQAAFTFEFGTPSNVQRSFAFAPVLSSSSDPFSRLFPDAAILIFEELANLDHPNPHSLGWMRTAQVNRLWRTTILGMSRLWACDFLARGYKRGLQLFVPHTQSSPLTLDLQLPREAPDMKRIRELFPRTKCLLRSGSDKVISHILEELGVAPLPLLEEVVLSCREQKIMLFYPKDYLSKHPRLRAVALHGCCLPSIPSQVTSLFISLRGWGNLSNATNLGGLLDSLDHTPGLQSLTIHFQEFVRGILPIGLNERKFHLPALTDLILNDPSVHTGEVVTAFIKPLDMPSLKKVQITQAFKYTIMNGGPALRRHDAAREFQELLTSFGSAPCSRNATYLGIDSRLLYGPEYQDAWGDAHIMAVHLGSHPPTHPSPTLTWPDGSTSLSLNVNYKYNPRHGFPITTSHAMQTAQISLQQVKVLEIDTSPFIGLSTSVGPLFNQCANVERIIVGRLNDHECTHGILQALTPSVPGDTNAFRQLPFHSESEIFLPHLRTVEFPNGNIDRIHFVELLTTRYARRVPLRHFVIPGEELELRIAISLGLTSVRDKVIGRLCGFATSVGAMMFIRDTSPQGKSGTCPTEIHFNYSSPPCI
ncbi:hypothetical protein PENSPDRAFT_751926 [Peniophora sp. CONT]|nr:hypothetical protein PENSPDRAFT_751926 [Peniophora sp. CONT]